MPMEGIRMHYISCGKNVSMHTDAFMAYYFDYYLRDDPDSLTKMAQENQLKIYDPSESVYIICLRKEGQQPICCRRCHRRRTVRHRGAMTRLLQRTFSDCYAGRIPLIYLMPAE